MAPNAAAASGSSGLRYDAAAQAGLARDLVRVDHEQDEFGGLHRQIRLLFDGVAKSVVRVGADAAGVDVEIKAFGQSVGASA